MRGNYRDGDSDFEDIPALFVSDEETQIRSQVVINKNAGWIKGDVNGYNEIIFDMYWPFTSAHEFNLVRYFIETKTSKSGINKFLKAKLHNIDKISFTSAHTMYNKIAQMDPSLGRIGWQSGSVEFTSGSSATQFYYRDILFCASFLLKQRAFATEMVYTPVKIYDGNGERVYSELHTADWWWRLQVI